MRPGAEAAAPGAARDGKAPSPLGWPPDPARWRPDPFDTPWWLRGAHAQTLGGKFLRPRPDPGLVRERIDTPDGDFLDLDHASDPDPRAPLVLLLHGLEGHTERGYVRCLMRALLERGRGVVGMNFRSCSGEPNRRARFYHSGDTGDLDVVLAHLRARHPGRPLAAVGVSLGGNVVLRWLGERGEAARGVLAAAAVVSVPFDLAAGARALEASLMGRVYAGYFLRSLKAKLEAKRALLEGVIDLDAALAARTMRAFDEVVTAPLHGYASADDYYARAASGPLVPAVRVPTLVVHALDDPFLPRERVPLDSLRANPMVAEAIVPRGGHVGFITGRTPGRRTFWMENQVARWLGG
ncbi:MAG: alpha/beta fold hydrolase [Gemmatimonadetes bacterium]|nr:MAG: alpha/beta fold hydrolase [Gemmatimonadota bacterium]